MQKAATHLEDPGCIQRGDVEVCGCVQQPDLFNFIYFGGKRSKQSITNLNTNHCWELAGWNAEISRVPTLRRVQATLAVLRTSLAGGVGVICVC